MVKVSLMSVLRSSQRSITHRRGLIARGATATVIVAVASTLAAPAGAAPSTSKKARSIAKSKLLWATVNVCDTVDKPNVIGIRASMPGSGIRAERMFMRFQIQFRAAADRKWHNVGKGGDSGFIDIGSGRYKARQTGRNFTIKPPKDGGAYRLRGAVTYEWRLDGEVVRRVRKRTLKRRGATRGADPKRYSAGSCVIR